MELTAEAQRAQRRPDAGSPATEEKECRVAGYEEKKEKEGKEGYSGRRSSF